MRILRELRLIAAIALTFAVVWYVYLGIRGTIYLTRHASQSSYPVSAGWYWGYTWVPASIAAGIGLLVGLLIVIARRLRPIVPPN